MRKLAGFVATFALGVAAVVAAPAMAQDAAAATVDLSVGTQVFDSEGAVLGTVASAQGANVVVDLGEGKQVTLPTNSFGKLEQGPTIGATKAQVVAAVDQAAAGSEAKLTAALRSEEHTSELQSLMPISYAVFCLKKKKKEYN